MPAQNLQAVPAPSPRKLPRHTFTIPESVRTKNDPSTITIQELSLEQDMHGQKLIEKSKNPYDKVKLSIVAADGKPLDWGKGEVDSLFESMSARARDLVSRAFIKVHTVEDSEASDFLDSQTVEI